MYVKASQLLRDALKVFGPEGERWTRGRYLEPAEVEGEPPRVCSVGALAYAAGVPETILWPCEMTEWELVDEVPYGRRAAYGRALQALNDVTEGEGIIDTNDDLADSFEDIQLVFKYAIVKAEENEE